MRSPAAGCVALAVLVLTGCGSSAPKIAGPAVTTTQVGGAIIQSKPSAPPIALHDDRGRAIRLSDFRGKWVAVAFIYTHCPDVCPLIAQNLNRALAKAHDLRVVAVSVDPKGDTPAAVRAYVAQKHLVPRFHYLIGSRAQLQPVWARYHVAAVANGADLVDHVAYTVLVDPHGKERLIYDAQLKAAEVVHDLRVLTPAS